MTAIMFGNNYMHNDYINMKPYSDINILENNNLINQNNLCSNNQKNSLSDLLGDINKFMTNNCYNNNNNLWQDNYQTNINYNSTIQILFQLLASLLNYIQIYNNQYYDYQLPYANNNVMKHHQKDNIYYNPHYHFNNSNKTDKTDYQRMDYRNEIDIQKLPSVESFQSFDSNLYDSGNKTIRERAVQIALNESALGINESDRSYLKYGQKGHWCGAFVDYCLSKAYGKTPPWKANNKNSRSFHSVLKIVKWAKDNNVYKTYNPVTVLNDVKPGDLIIFQSNPKSKSISGRRKNSNHVGIVTKVYPDGSIDTVEGNTANKCKKRHYKADNPRIQSFMQVHKLP